MANLTSTIKLALDSTAVKKGIAKLKASFKGMAKELANGFKTAAKAGAALFAGVTAATVLYFKKFANEMDRIGKLSKSFKETAESMQRIDHAAKLAGVDVEAVAKATRQFVKSIVEAEAGAKTYVREFEALGLSYKDLIDLPMEEQLLRISTAFRNAGGSARALAALQNLMGRQGAEMATLVAEGPEALSAAFEEAVTVSGRTVRAMELVNDTFTRMRNVAKGAFADAVGAFVPAIEENAPKFTEKFKELGALAGGVLAAGVKGNLEPLLSVLQFVATRFAEMVAGAVTQGAMAVTTKAVPNLAEKYADFMTGWAGEQSSNPWGTMAIGARQAVGAGSDFLRGFQGQGDAADFQTLTKGTLGSSAAFDEMNRSLDEMKRLAKEESDARKSAEFRAFTNSW